MRRLFCAISADRHAAPTPRASACVIREEKRARRAFASFDMREVFRADEAR
jgi:hypothetical protein